MAQQQKVGKANTTITRNGGTVTVRYHETDVVEFNEKRIILNSGGWFTKTTRTRMNQTARQFGLDCFVFAHKGIWNVLINGAIVPFKDGLVITR